MAEAITTESFSNLISPFNYVANSAEEKLLPIATKLNLGVIAMKTLGRGGLSGDVEQALRYVWRHDVDAAIVGMKKISEVEQNVAAADNFQPITEKEKKQLQKVATEIIKEDRLNSEDGVVSPRKR